MKVSAINTIPRINFQGESSKNTNGVKSAAGAAVIALAALAPTEEANAQYYAPIPPHIQYYVPAAPAMNVPRCFVVGDEASENYEKTVPDVFNEIDREIEENGQISVNEVVQLEEANWNLSNYTPMTRAQKQRTADLVKNLSRRYNEYGSNPNTISYSEYKKIMNAYMQSKNIADFVNLLQLLMVPQCPPHHHHHHPHPPMTPPPYHR